MMKLLVSLLLVFLVSCTGQDQKTPTAIESKSTATADTSTAAPVGRDTAFRPEVFASFPDTLSGCSSYFTYDSLQVTTGNYIFLTNYRDLALIKVNGRVIYLNKDYSKSKQLGEDQWVDVYTSEGYTVTLETKRTKSVDEVSYYTGTLRITGNRVDVQYPVRGEGGC